MICERRVAVLEGEAALLLADKVLPLYVHLCGRGSEVATQSYSLKLSVEHIVASETIPDDERLALAGFCGHRHGGVGTFRRCEIEVSRVYVHAFGSEGEVKALRLAVEERHVLAVVSASAAALACAVFCCAASFAAFSAFILATFSMESFCFCAATCSADGRLQMPYPMMTAAIRVMPMMLFLSTICFNYYLLIFICYFFVLLLL